MSPIEFIQLAAVSLAVAFVVSVVAYAVSSSMERAEEEDAETLRIQLGAEPVRVHGMPEGEFNASQVQDDDPYLRAMVAAAMNASGPVMGRIDRNGDLRITTPD